MKEGGQEDLMLKKECHFSLAPFFFSFSFVFFSMIGFGDVLL